MLYWMEAHDPASKQSATLDFGPAGGASRISEVLGLDVPGDTNYAAHMTSADDRKVQMSYERRGGNGPLIGNARESIRSEVEARRRVHSRFVRRGWRNSTSVSL